MYVPHIDAETNRMSMLGVDSMEDMNSFRKNKWGILEPPSESVAKRRDGMFNGYSSTIDKIIITHF